VFLEHASTNHVGFVGCFAFCDNFFFELSRQSVALSAGTSSALTYSGAMLQHGDRYLSQDQ